jgi:hypothetical protein
MATRFAPAPTIELRPESRGFVVLCAYAMHLQANDAGLTRLT